MQMQNKLLSYDWADRQTLKYRMDGNYKQNSDNRFHTSNWKSFQKVWSFVTCGFLLVITAAVHCQTLLTLPIAHTDFTKAIITQKINREFTHVCQKENLFYISKDLVPVTTNAVYHKRWEQSAKSFFWGQHGPSFSYFLMTVEATYCPIGPMPVLKANSIICPLCTLIACILPPAVYIRK